MQRLGPHPVRMKVDWILSASDSESGGRLMLSNGLTSTCRADVHMISKGRRSQSSHMCITPDQAAWNCEGPSIGQTTCTWDLVDIYLPISQCWAAAVGCQRYDRDELALKV